eukprot:GHVT01094080.1.p1 GENE.GHVT01094080.1~~GHVT01094080.1.p1  ORF type:complete len:161 (-),score=36.37 GHVT01094080.1:202-684(-)
MAPVTTRWKRRRGPTSTTAPRRSPTSSAAAESPNRWPSDLWTPAPREEMQDRRTTGRAQLQQRGSWSRALGPRIAQCEESFVDITGAQTVVQGGQRCVCFALLRRGQLRFAVHSVSKESSQQGFKLFKAPRFVGRFPFQRRGKKLFSLVPTSEAPSKGNH